MVAGIYFIVYLAVVWLYIVGTENVVYAEVKSFLIVRPSESFSCCGEAVFEYCRYFVARVGNGGIAYIIGKDNESIETTEEMAILYR